jgi:hypothetical protein
VQVTPVIVFDDGRHDEVKAIDDEIVTWGRCRMEMASLG